MGTTVRSVAAIAAAGAITLCLGLGSVTTAVAAQPTTTTVSTTDTCTNGAEWCAPTASPDGGEWG